MLRALSYISTVAGEKREGVFACPSEICAPGENVEPVEIAKAELDVNADPKRLRIIRARSRL